MTKPLIVSVDPVNSISVGVTWVDGRLVFKEHTKYAQFYYGVCHYSRNVFAVTPLDYEKPLMITTVKVSKTENYCSRAYSCLNFGCPHNKFDKDVFKSHFRDCGSMSLGIPHNFGNEGIWFIEDPDLKEKWAKCVIGYEGGVLRFNEEGDGLHIVDPWGVS